MKKQLYLNAFRLMGPMTASQLSRFMTGIGFEPSDMGILLAELVEEKQLKQSVSLQGIVYSLTEKDIGKPQSVDLSGNSAGTSARIPLPEEAMMAEKAGEFRTLFAREKDYLAQYTEQANAVVPVFLSIRDGDKILLKISIIVETTEEAKKICAGWMLNSHKTYEAVWDSIAGEMPVPAFYTKLLEKTKNDVNS
jgi:hypothetical protein